MTEIGKDSPATIRIRFVTEDDLVSALIRQHTWCEYSHVEFVLDDGTTLGAHFSGGVAIRPANYAKFTRVAEFVVLTTVARKLTIMSFAHAQVGKDYDCSAIAGDLMHRDWRDDAKWFCSELVTVGFEQADPILAPRVGVNRIVPRDLLLSLRLLVVGGLVQGAA
jgi:uncharacterized protein YycO